MAYFRGSELQGYFTRVLEEKFKTLIKPQYVDHIPRAAKGTVGKIVTAKDERKKAQELAKVLDLEPIMEREIKDLSGGELQRFAIAVVAVRDCDVYMFDEPSSYLDVRQRLSAARVIRSLLTEDKYVESMSALLT